MKRLHRLLLMATTLLLLGMDLRPVHAEGIHTYLDSQEVRFPIPPVMEDGCTLVPVRALLEALGGTVTWEPSTRTVSATLGEHQIQAVIGETTARVDGRPAALQVASQVVDGYTLIPVRFFAEHLGMWVSWDEETRSIYLDRSRVDRSSRGGTANRRAAAALTVARELVGAPYRWGGASPETGFDCSGFVYYVGSQAGLTLPRTSEEMYTLGVAVPLDQLMAGDLVFFSTYGEGATHVGIYDGEGGFIHAQSPETGVRVTPLSSPWWAQRYLGARRVFR